MAQWKQSLLLDSLLPFIYELLLINVLKEIVHNKIIQSNILITEANTKPKS